MTIVKKIFAAALLAWFGTAAFAAAVDVNKANQAELEGVKGIGPAMSARILEARKTAAFRDWADLQSRVKGFGDARSQRLSSDGLTVNGTPYKGGDAASRSAKVPKTAKAPKASGKSTAAGAAPAGR